MSKKPLRLARSHCEPTAHKFMAIITTSDFGHSAHRSEGAVIYCQRCGEVRALPLPLPSAEEMSA